MERNLQFSLIQQILITCDVKTGVVLMNPDWAVLHVDALNEHSIRFEAIQDSMRIETGLGVDTAIHKRSKLSIQVT